MTTKNFKNKFTMFKFGNTNKMYVNNYVKCRKYILDMSNYSRPVLSILVPERNNKLYPFNYFNIFFCIFYCEIFIYNQSYLSFERIIKL